MSFFPENKVYIIAEAGSNHLGNLDVAKNLIRVSAEGGADAVKFQFFRADEMYPRNAGSYFNGEDIYQIMEEAEMPFFWLEELCGYCNKRNMDFLCSVFSERGVDLVDPYVDAHKIASYEITHKPLLTYVAGKGKPVILSTGCSTAFEAWEAVKTLKSGGCEDITVMQCTGKYPSSPESLNLSWLGNMNDHKLYRMGFSDHSEDIIAPIIAISLGAKVIEKHITLGKDLPGPDQAFALTPIEFDNMVKYIRYTEKSLGTGIKNFHPSEFKLRNFCRRSIFSTMKILKGDKITTWNTRILRCGNLKGNLPPSMYSALLGKKTTREVQEGFALERRDVEWS